MEIKNSTLKNFLKDKEQSGMYKSLIIRRLEETFELYPKLTFGEVIHYMQNSTGDLSHCKNWADSNSLKRIENVQRQLSDCYNPVSNTFDKNDDAIDELFLAERKIKNPKIYG